MIPALLMALNQNGAEMPILATKTPPSAGPMARLTFMPTLLAAIAGLRSALGTSCGTIACQAGAVSALVAPLRNVNSSRLNGVAAPSQTMAAKIADTTVAATSPIMRNLRRSTMSESAPAGIANRNIGSVVATCTSDTISGSGLSVVISQPEAALYIQPPILATTVAVHSIAKMPCRNGLNAEGGG